MKFQLFLALLILLSFHEANSLKISEIAFSGDEYIEIFSEENINFTDAKLIKLSNLENYNTFTQVKKVEDSPYILLIGTRFRDSTDIQNLNCSIYISGRSQTAFGGFRSSGENFIIIKDNETLINYSNHEFETPLQTNLSYHIMPDSSYILGSRLPCTPPELQNLICPKTPNFEFSSEEKISVNSEKFPLNLNIKKNFNSLLNITIKINNSIICEQEFEIETLSPYFTGQIAYRFQTPEANVNITYWIENLEGQEIIAKRETLNKNWKFYTPPSGIQIYNIMATLKTPLCAYNASKLAPYYNPVKNFQENESNNSNSHIKILNSKDFAEGKTNSILFEAIKGGDTRKYLLALYHNGKRVFQVHLQEGEKISESVNISLVSGLNHILLEGLDLSEEIFLKLPEQKMNFFEINNLFTHNNIVFFNINSDLQNLSGNCKIQHIRTQISNELNLSNYKDSEIAHLEINLSTLMSREENLAELTLRCEYRHTTRITPIITTQNFLFEINNKIEEKNQSLEILNSPILTSLQNTYNSNQISRDQINSEENVIESYESKNEIIKKYALIPLIISILLLFSGLVFGNFKKFF